MANEYATLAQIRAYLNVTDTADDTKLQSYLAWASRRIDKHCHGRRFYPRIATLEFDYQRDPQNIYVNEDLLAVTTLTIDDTSIAAADYKLYPLNKYPKHRIALLLNQSNVFTYSSTPQATVDVAGTWGYHDDWDNAWLDTGDTVQDASGINTTVTSVTFTNIDGVCADGFTRRCSEGNLLKIGTEYLQVTATDTTTNIATVRRGVNGSTAASHANAAAISVYQVPEMAKGACLDVCKWIYEHRDQAGGIIAIPSLEGTAIEMEIEKILMGWHLPRRAADLVDISWQ
jgi:hypothetical protein